MTKEEYEQEYDRLFKWRERWTRLASRPEPDRLQTRQEAIERRAAIADGRIRALMSAYDREHVDAETLSELAKDVEVGAVDAGRFAASVATYAASGMFPS